MAANHLPPEKRGRPFSGIRGNGKDEFKDNLYEMIFTGIIKELNRNDIEYGHAIQTRSIRNFTFIDDLGKMRAFTIKIVEEK